MKSRHVLSAVCLAVMLLASGRVVSAQGFSTNISVDENGAGRLTNTNGFDSSLPGTLLPDPGPGGLPLALTFGLLNPPGLVAGDLLLFEPGAPGTLSDIIRFNPNQNGGSLVFYSDRDDGSNSLADTGFPTALYANVLSLVEVGLEGANGFTYTPTAGQPGFVSGAAGPVTYNIVSDLDALAPVPEPATFGMAAVAGIAGLVAYYRRRKRTACPTP